jgi:hypothetical protein
METGILIMFKLPRKDKKIEMRSAVKIYRKLYGYNNSSFYGRYHTRIPGLLDNVKHVRYPNSVILIGKKDKKKIIDFLKENNAEIYTWEIKLSKKEAKQLGY